jgi:hypothetical protein
VTDVPFVDLCAQWREVHDEFSELLESVLSRAACVMGRELKELEPAREPAVVGDALLRGFVDRALEVAL